MLKNLISDDEAESRIDNEVNFLIPDPDPLNVKRLVSTDVSDKINRIELRQGQLFWVYLFE